MKSCASVVALVSLLAVGACEINIGMGTAHDLGPDGRAAGTANGPCYPNQTCDAGLSCIGGLCLAAADAATAEAAPPPDATVDSALPDMALGDRCYAVIYLDGVTVLSRELVSKMPPAVWLNLEAVATGIFPANARWDDVEVYHDGKLLLHEPFDAQGPWMLCTGDIGTGSVSNGAAHVGSDYGNYAYAEPSGFSTETTLTFRAATFWSPSTVRFRFALHDDPFGASCDGLGVRNNFLFAGVRRQPNVATLQEIYTSTSHTESLATKPADGWHDLQLTLVCRQGQSR